ncbi:protein tyrosine phosphatase receptor type C-associated protein [Alligator mississippiensis]|uniref:Protein tyrosine phosphatase receptor type C-associated protein n=1 Tax=Alligator mississippiensis TaxID=8496 RepID=A0A151MU65_ALLMI|nr:protein tyrosine phosphatase receptor type C-associated protein [Alligator mississippiensis]
MGLRPWGVLLLLLPGIVLGSNQNEDRDSITVVLLVLFLLLLLLVLSLAWHKLSKDSDGKYHPKRLSTWEDSPGEGAKNQHVTAL